jgi:hypothetical protein
VRRGQGFGSGETERRPAGAGDPCRRAGAGFGAAAAEPTPWPVQTQNPLLSPRGSHPKRARAPRSAAHCIEYAHLILWSQQRQGDEFDADSEEHMKWVYERAAERARQYGIPVSQ